MSRRHIINMNRRRKAESETEELEEASQDQGSQQEESTNHSELVDRAEQLRAELAAIENELSQADESRNQENN